MPLDPVRLLGAAVLCLATAEASAFCGFYVGKADAGLFNRASQVILVRHQDRTVISMLNDYRGALKEFALVVPVPQVLQRGQIHVGDKRLFDRIDAYSSPRLAEYYDDSPCLRAEPESRRFDMAGAAAPAASARKALREVSLGVTVEAAYTVGEYDIVILSAKQSDGLESWLRDNGYRIPRGASAALKPYVRQQMKFFVAKVNLKEQARTGLTTLRPLQFAFESRKFMLPLRLGMVNADGPQDLIAYVLTPRGRVEATNYRTVKLPADMDLPVHVRSDFTGFYKAMFDRQARSQGHRVVFTEYFWDMSWCDPCAADPLTPEELKAAGVFWLEGKPDETGALTVPQAARRALSSGPQPVMLTRLHLRYTRDTFPEDLVFQETDDRANFQTRYVLRHAWAGSVTECPEARLYFESVARRQEKEAERLAALTGWDLEAIRARMHLSRSANEQWWEALWQ
jgi:hypothetical protein